MTQRVAWIFEGYGQNGGNYTNNIIAKILDQDFNYEPRLVYQKYAKVSQGSVLPLHNDYALVNISNVFGNVDKTDLVISNPNLSNSFIGARVPCKTIMHAQGFSTYTILDAFFTHYVAVSDFIQMQLKSIYDISSHVIPPFIDFEMFPTPIPFSEKKNEVLIYSKYSHSYFQMMYNKVSRILKRDKIPYTIMNNRDKISQKDLYQELNKYRYVMFLSIAEGFGLVPLETMYMKGVVCGFDGFGGRHYMNSNNCLNVPYPNIDMMCQRLNSAFHGDVADVISISELGRKTALDYGKSRFTASWKNYLSSVLEK